MLFFFFSTSSTLWQASIFSGDPCAVLIQALYASFNRLSSFGAVDGAQATSPGAITAMSISFFIAWSSTRRQAQGLPLLALEDGERCNHNELHVALILEDVAVTAAPARDVGVVVIFGEVQFKHGAFRTTVLQGVDRIQAV